MPENQNSDAILWKGGIYPAILVAASASIFFAFLKGRPGLLASLLASFTVIIFFSIHLAVARISRDLDPMITMALAMFSYFAKVVFMGIFLVLVTKFTDRATVDRASFAICAILITLAWLFGEIRSFMKLRFQLPLPIKKGE